MVAIFLLALGVQASCADTLELGGNAATGVRPERWARSCFRSGSWSTCPATVCLFLQTVTPFCVSHPTSVLQKLKNTPVSIHSVTDGEKMSAEGRLLFIACFSEAAVTDALIDGPLMGWRTQLTVHPLRKGQSPAVSPGMSRVWVTG